MNYFEIVEEIIKILWEEEWPEYQADRIFDLLLKENLISSFNRNEIKEAWEKMDAPTIEAGPIKHGRWNDNKVAFHRVCSECGAVVRQDISLIYLLECMEKVGHLNYCPNCGAIMDEVEE